MSEINDDQVLAAYAKHKTERAAAEKLGMPKSTFHDRLHAARANMFRVQKMEKPRIIKPKKGATRRFLLTCAQNATQIHESFLDNLEAYAEFLDAEIMVSGFTYNKRLFENHGSGDAVYHERVAPYLVNQRVQFGDNLTFCAENQTNPTAVNPLSGMATYTQHRDGIFPHTKIRLESVATMKSKPAKVNMTTGAVTMPNYVQKKTGQKAEFHHVIGAVIVELMGDGRHFVRHLLANEITGGFDDLIYHVVNGEVVDARGTNVRSLNYGDSHFEKTDYTASEMSFGDRPDSLLNLLRPQYQFFHDATDFTARNKHNVNDPHFLFKMFINGTESVEANMRTTYEFLEYVDRDFCQTEIVESNHHESLAFWLKTADYKRDPVNALFFLKAQLASYEAIARDDDNFDVYEHVLTTFFGDGIKDTHFIPKDGELEIDGIEYGLHGHRGANGSRGSAAGLSKVASKINMGHVHSPAIIDGVYAAGITCSMDMGYNVGPSSWAHSNIITYTSGKRTIITMNGDLFHAPLPDARLL